MNWDPILDPWPERREALSFLEKWARVCNLNVPNAFAKAFNEGSFTVILTFEFRKANYPNKWLKETVAQIYFSGIALSHKPFIFEASGFISTGWAEAEFRRHHYCYKVDATNALSPEWPSAGHLVDRNGRGTCDRDFPFLVYKWNLHSSAVLSAPSFSTSYFSCHWKHLIFTFNLYRSESYILKILTVVSRACWEEENWHVVQFHPVRVSENFSILFIQSRIQIIGKDVTLKENFFSWCKLAEIL